MNLTPVDVVDILARIIAAIARLVRVGASRTEVLAAVKRLEDAAAAVDVDVNMVAQGLDPRAVE